MRTEFFVEYDLYDTTALQDGVETTESNSDFADIKLLKENVSAPSYGTLEHNFFVLDGSMEEFPDNPDNIAYFSKDFIQQNSNYNYCGDGMYMGDDLDGPIEEVYEKQKVVVQFSENHTSFGITLHFLDVWPLETEIAWYDLAGNFAVKTEIFSRFSSLFLQESGGGLWAYRDHIYQSTSLPQRQAAVHRIWYNNRVGK